jgi:hypothetical protein
VPPLTLCTDLGKRYLQRRIIRESFLPILLLFLSSAHENGGEGVSDTECRM